MAKKPTYYELLKHPRWQAKRLQIMQRAEFQCEWCSDADTTLNVHHIYYVRDAAPWEYPDTALLCLCESCHAQIHDMRHTLDILISRIAHEQEWLHQLIGYARALSLNEVPVEEWGSTGIDFTEEGEEAGVAHFFRVDWYTLFKMNPKRLTVLDLHHMRNRPPAD